jgi:hypothetical protein
MIARLICWWAGHRRGKRVGITATGTRGGVYAEFRCPRCNATWSRKEKS